jgi:putative ABC transport system permease protein
MMADTLESLRVAFDGLAANKMRSALTMLGVIIGVAAVVALMSIGKGAQASITGEISSIGSNLFFVAPGTVNFGPGHSGGAAAESLIYEDAEAIADNVPSVDSVAPQFDQQTQVIFGEESVNAPVTGVTPAYQETINGVELAQGRFIADKDVDGRTNVAVLGHQTARDLFGGFDPLGQKIKVAVPGGNGGRVSLTVVGVVTERSSSGMTDPNEVVLVPITTAQTGIFDGRNAWGEPLVTRISVMAVSEEQVDVAADEVTALLRDRHNLDADEDDDFTVVKQEEILETATAVTDTLTVFLGAIAAISLLVGGVGIMNIMLVSVTERTREIGIRKAVGARKSDILSQFLLEAVIQSLLGGVIGVLLGIGLAKIVDMTGMMTSQITVDSIALAVGFSLAVGLFFGIYPANQAANLNPIEALRYE